MSDDTLFARRNTAGGTAAAHPPQQTHAAFVGPTTSDDVNTLKVALVPIACWRLDDVRFDFNSSFVLPDAAAEFTEFAALRSAHPGAPASIFGHADPVGNDDYNKQLSGRRAQAVYGAVTRNADIWEHLYSTPFGNDHWGTRQIQIMLPPLGFDSGEPDGQMGPKTHDAIVAFQNAFGLTPDGSPGPTTRKWLFSAYMATLCADLPALDPQTDFLGQGADPGGKADLQGCSEFKPVLMFSAQENAAYEQSWDKTDRNADNALNRRVIIFLFKPGTRVDVNRWPCPRVSEGIGGCRKRFWSDADRRRQFQEERREFEVTRDTFACRFYERLATSSPCEQKVVPLIPWTAQWDRPLVHFGDTAQMILNAPGLAAGETVTFQVVQEAQGVQKPIGQVQVVSVDDGATAPWSDWYQPGRATYNVTLNADASDPTLMFPPVIFHFTAVTVGQTTPEAAPLAYFDAVDITLTYNGTSDPLKQRLGTLHSPWGTVSSLSDDTGHFQMDELPPGGVSLTLDDYPLLVLGA